MPVEENGRFHRAVPVAPGGVASALPSSRWGRVCGESMAHTERRLQAGVVRQQVAPWLTSLILHAVTLVVLGMFVFGRPGPPSPYGLVFSTGAPLPEPVMVRVDDTS